MKRFQGFALFLILLPALCAADSSLQGYGCVPIDQENDLREARLLVRHEAIRQAIESSGVLNELPPDVSPTLIRDIVQILQSGHLEGVRTLKHTETGDAVCETVEARADIEELRRVVRQEFTRRNHPTEGPELESNACLKLLAIEEDEDRYGRRVTTVVRVKRATGPLHTAEHRRSKPCFKACIDYLGPGGVPRGGDARYVDDSAEGILEGELRTIHFHIPKGVQSYRVWLPEERKSEPGTRTRAAAPEQKELAPPHPADSKRTIVSIETSTGPGGLRVKVLSDGPIDSYRTFYMQSPPRLVIDLPGRWQRPGFHARRLDSPLAERIRMGYHPRKMRLVLDLPENEPTPEAVIRETSKGLVIELQATMAATEIEERRESEDRE